MRGVSPPGLLFLILGAGLLAAPFMTLAANRIVAGQPFTIWALAQWPANYFGEVGKV